jgi:hypothetical protein
MSSLFMAEHFCRLISVSPDYYVKNRWLTGDAVAVCFCWIGDILTLFILCPMLIREYREDKEGLKFRFHESLIILFRVSHLALLYRIYRYLRNEWSPASEMAQTNEVLGLLKDDMPNIDIKSVQVISNTRSEQLAYRVEKDKMRQRHGTVREITLFFGPRHIPTRDIWSNPNGLCGEHSRDGPLGKAVYGAERPSYSDINAYVTEGFDETFLFEYTYQQHDEEPLLARIRDEVGRRSSTRILERLAEEDRAGVVVRDKDGEEIEPSADMDEDDFPVTVVLKGHDVSKKGHTRQMLVYKALVGNSQDVGQEFQDFRTKPDLEFDSVQGGPWAPENYTPDDFGLPQRDVHSVVHALYEPRGQALLIASVTYENPDAHEEIERLKENGVDNWWDYNERKLKHVVSMNGDQQSVYEALDQVMEERDLDAFPDAVQKCREAGVPEKNINELKLRKKQESEEAGISLAYILSDDFAKQAREATGKEDPSFMDMKEPFFVNEATRRNEKRLCPRDLKRGCSFVDSLPANQRKKATHFLSWVWRYSLSVFCGAMRMWLEKNNEDPEKIFFWVCFFCNNQWRIMIDQANTGSENLETIFESRLSSIGKMVVVMDSWEDPIYVKRIWTIYEQFIAAKLGIKIAFTLPDEPSTTLIDELNKGRDGIKNVIAAISHVDAENAEATVKDDEDKVKDAIRANVGFDAVNRQVKKSISEWIAKTFKSHIDKLVLEDDVRKGSSTPRPS